MDKQIELLCQHYLSMLYQKQNSSHYKPSNIAETSGEILYESINKLKPIMNLQENDVFADLGSAEGKIVSQLFLTTSVKTVVGIEIVPELHTTAIQVSQHIKDNLPDFFENNRNMNFINGNFMQIPLDNFTVILINSMCFSSSLLDELGKIINPAKNIRLVLTLRPLFNLQRLVLKKVIPIECSWDSSLCYCYGLRF